MEVAVNWWAIIVSMIAAVAIGFVWYGPLFGKAWMRESGISMPEGEKPSMVKPIILSLVGALFLAYVMSVAGGGLTNAFWYWLGFIVPVYLNYVGWEGKSWKLFSISAGYWLAVFLAFGAIIAGWQ